MLKIKDEIPLKELEKFGFEFNYSFYAKETNGISYFVNGINSRNIRQIEVSTYDGDGCILDDTLYDLIQARIGAES